MTENRIHLSGRIDQIVRDFFELNKSVNEIQAKELMPLFVKKGIFKKDVRNGLPIRNLLRELDSANKLRFLHNIKVVRNDVNRNWYFINKK